MGSLEKIRTTSLRSKIIPATPSRLRKKNKEYSMSNARNQMKELATSILKSKEERLAFLEKNRIDMQRKRIEIRNDLSATSQEISRQSKDLMDGLQKFRRNLKSSVVRTLRDNQRKRFNLATAQRHQLRQEIAKNRRNILRFLSQNNAERKRAAKNQDRQCLTVLKGLRRRVAEIRRLANKFTSDLREDRAEGRRLWASILGANARPSRSLTKPPLSSPSLLGRRTADGLNLQTLNKRPTSTLALPAVGNSIPTNLTTN